ncbi:MAG: gamma-glutamyl-gamma-aminobutyrate hydrolase family protein [Dehalococcoidia bacterium]|nr:gamma-glutamyl-gamma-aminobutyrate hydrolase family protein [Dehalococcoidia bacterium]
MRRSGEPIASPAPRIGVTRWEDVAGESVERYWSAVRQSGGLVVDLSEANAGEHAVVARTLDGLMITGGVDVDPARYGAIRHEKVRTTHPERDAMETACIDVAIAREIPVLAICRGHQLLNVALGGTLLQHIDSGEHRADLRAGGMPSRWHEVRIDPASRLAGILGETQFRTNSRHHQAVRATDLAPGLRPVAFADEHGVELIEGVEGVEQRWLVGVQWHPERPEVQQRDFAPRMRRLFDAFVREAAAAAEGRSASYPATPLD